MYGRKRIQIEEIVERVLYLSYFNLLSAQEDCISRYIEITSTNKKNRVNVSLNINHLK